MATQQNIPMVSETSICNQALTWLGQKPINSLDDPNEKAEWMRNNYPFVRDAVVEEGLWSFATVRGKSEVTQKDAWGQMYAHPKPPEWMAVKRVYLNVDNWDRSNWTPDESWELSGDYVLSNSSVIYLYGVERVTDTGKFTPMFVQALAARLAADAAIPITENRLLQRELWVLWERKLIQALAQDGQQAKMERLRARRLERSR